MTKTIHMATEEENEKLLMVSLSCELLFCAGRWLLVCVSGLSLDCGRKSNMTPSQVNPQSNSIKRLNQIVHRLGRHPREFTSRYNLLINCH